MQNDKISEANFGFAELARELLGLDPRALASMDPMKTSVAAGLHEFMRRTLDRALGLLWAPDETVIRLNSDWSAKACGWPDAKTLNLSSLFVWAMIREPRLTRGRSQIPLCPVDAKIIDFHRRPHEDEDMSTASLVAMTVELFRPDAKAQPRAPNSISLHHCSVCALVEEMLGVSPEFLNRPCQDEPLNAEEAFVGDPEEQAADALSALLMSILDVYQAAVANEVDRVRLLIVDDAGGLGYARTANIATCFIAGLLADGQRDVAFVV